MATGPERNNSGRTRITAMQLRTRVFVISVMAVVAVLLVLGIIDTAIYSGRIHKGVSISGIPVGGKDKNSAMPDIKSLANSLEAKKITLSYRNRTWTLNPKEIGYHIDGDGTYEKALNVGKQDGFIKNTKVRIGLWFSPTTVEPAYKYDQHKLDKFIKQVCKEIDIPTEDAAIKIVEGRTAMTGSRDGREVKKQELQNLILKALDRTDAYSIALPVVMTKPDITESDLADAQKDVNQMVKAPITIKYQTNTWDIDIQQITSWIDFKKVREGNHWSLNAILDRNEVTARIEELTKGLITEPKDADFKIEGDLVTIVPSSDGLRVNIDKAYDDVLEASRSTDDREIMLSTRTAKPKLSTEDANKMGIKEKVTSFTTTFNPGQAPRVHNIRLLAGVLDGTILAPGEVFSFNGAIGPRTAEKGYQEAPAIVNGKLEPSLGGGVCQVATTLYNTVFFGGFEVVERHNHSFFISHYPTGRDATVSWGGPDLKFKNNYPTHILIKTVTTASSITISFYGTNQGYKVEYTTDGPSNLRPAPTQTVNDPTLPLGVKKVTDEGVDGRDVTVNRRVLNKDGAEIKKDKFVSRYTPKKNIVNVGTGPASAEPTTTPAPQ